MIDSHRHKGLRNKLAATLKERGITDQAVLQAIESVPRHFFLDTSFVEIAYEDRAFPIGAGQTISHPYTVAFQTQLLELKKGEKVLEIGTGSGYQTSVLVQMGMKVFTIERQKSLYDKTKRLLTEMGYAPKFFYGDGYLGLPTFAPFDKILVTAGAPLIPRPLMDQLKVGGILVVPVGEGASQVMTLLKKKATNEFVKKEFGEFKFVPLLEEKAR